MGLAGRDSYGRVFVTRKVKAMASYVSFGRFTVPRLAFYASLFTGIAAALYTVFNFNSLSAYGVAVPAGARAFFWFEAYKLWKYRLLEKTAKNKRTISGSLIPGLVALASFIVASYFLFYYIEPAGPAIDTSVPVERNVPLPPSPGSPVTAEDIPVAEHDITVELFWRGLASMNFTMLLFVGGLQQALWYT
jgi:hypothetical protein